MVTLYIINDKSVLVTYTFSVKSILHPYKLFKKVFFIHMSSYYFRFLPQIAYLILVTWFKIRAFDDDDDNKDKKIGSKRIFFCHRDQFAWLL